jgi:hypothetical protein
MLFLSGEYPFSLVVAAAANNDHNCKYDDPGAVVIKDVA